MKTLQIISNGNVIKEITVGDNITKKQIAGKIKFLYPDFDCLLTFSLIAHKVS